METKKRKKHFGGGAGLIMLGCFAVAVCVFLFVFGNPANFEGFNSADFNGWWDAWKNFDTAKHHPLDGNLLGTVYKGGVIVPIIQTLLLTVIALSVERYIALRKAKGKGNLTTFAQDIKAALAKEDLAAANELCKKQKGSVANVVTTALAKYEEVAKDETLSKEQKTLAIQKEIEEATALELPMLSQNLPIIATITTLGTLMGLLGTVIGMIRSFASLAGAGGTDSIALSQGISEALINTAFGIATGALAVISYNYYTSKIDTITYCIDEVGFTIVQSFAAKH